MESKKSKSNQMIQFETKCERISITFTLKIE
jgi:hypothetical protein